jgi:hypothetical protein
LIYLLPGAAARLLRDAAAAGKFDLVTCDWTIEGNPTLLNVSGGQLLRSLSIIPALAVILAAEQEATNCRSQALELAEEAAVL